MGRVNYREFSLQEFRDNMKQSTQEKSGLSLTIDAVASVFRALHISNTLLRQRNLLYKDSQSLTFRDNFGYVISLAMAGVSLYAAGMELTRRAENGQSLLATEHNEQVDATSTITSAVAIGFNAAEVKNGRTVFKKRQYSTYGRVYVAFTSTVSAAQLALRLATAK
ncbi:MAG: hypothetical protein H6797_03535 [Candidatus Nomurabacteria bacterium]|nr:MAG: hypothetical protein H6797_03535 [Candidatus Nomurabacteria bacterium]